MGARQLETNRKPITIFLVCHVVAGLGVMLHIVNPGPDIDDRFEHRVGRHILHFFTVHPYLTTVTNGVSVFVTISNHDIFPWR